MFDISFPRRCKNFGRSKLARIIRRLDRSRSKPFRSWFDSRSPPISLYLDGACKLNG
jgi:hypothetical protein